MKAGDTVWFLNSGVKRKAVILRMTKSDAVIRFPEGGGIRISLNRLFESEDDIDEYIKNRVEKERIGFASKRKNQYDYM